MTTANFDDDFVLFDDLFASFDAVEPPLEGAASFSFGACGSGLIPRQLYERVSVDEWVRSAPEEIWRRPVA